VNYNSFLLHIPHSSLIIPDGVFIGDERKLLEEVNNQTDLYVDELFNFEFSNNIKRLVFGYNRFYCDVERFWGDEEEPMSKIGQGVYYEKFLDGSEIKRLGSKDTIKAIYDNHHAEFKRLSDDLLSIHGNCLIIECHSFTDRANTPDICIGINNDNNDVHSETLTQIIKNFETNGYSVDINNPYSGSIHPINTSEPNLKTVMFEINKRCYLKDNLFIDNEKYQKLKKTIKEIIIQ